MITSQVQPYGEQKDQKHDKKTHTRPRPSYHPDTSTANMSAWPPFFARLPDPDFTEAQSRLHRVGFVCRLLRSFVSRS
ncbi:hypothetical protein PAXRUDRAFT_830954 [Paxillus rubicundulus Ve08.2h10]|uniref:Uncharacterized protein n=1 Tax=Paxillus rubicundulus Ve08.2h10 TaxID=930991 RepID=A0A0D0E301_9AGAM|nr:hypothetical protein PAXRUDRAFT_830954 [Paxillus rubicundulus Ve08.2h10]